MRRASIISAVAAATIVAGAVQAAVGPVSATGWNKDVIATTAEGTPDLATTGGIENDFWVLYEAGYANPDSSTAPGGLNATGIYGDYQLQPYDQANALVLGNSQTLALDVINAQLNSLSMLATAVDGGGTMSYVITYTDASTSSDSVAVPDWYFAPGFMVNNIGRMPRPYNFNAGENIDEGPRLYSINLTVDSSKVVDSIEFTYSDDTPNAPGAAIFGLAGDVVPEPASASLLLLGALGLRRRRRTAAR